MIVFETPQQAVQEVFNAREEIVTACITPEPEFNPVYIAIIVGMILFIVGFFIILCWACISHPTSRMGQLIFWDRVEEGEEPELIIPAERRVRFIAEPEFF